MDAMHAALFPFPDHGHVSPMLQLALHLSSRGAYVTFINTELGRQKLPAFCESLTNSMNIRFLCISDGLPANQEPLSLEVVLSQCGKYVDVGSSAMPALLHSLKSQGPSLLKLLTELNGMQIWPPFSCLISDSFMPWTAEVASELHISWMVFWAASATRLCLTTMALEHKETDAELLRRASKILRLAHEGTCMPDLLQLLDSQKLQHLKARIKALRKAELILLNSVNELEGEALKELLEFNFHIKPLGPLCISAELEEKNADNECLAWLDKQAARSVLYISFGSKVVLQGELLEQLASGIESSNIPFLWALRTGGKGLPEGFLRRTHNRQKIMTWVPQKRVLEHGAVGAFFTHCGWNSVLEAVVEGVPMICHPIFGDQPTNKLLIEQKWRIGRGVPGKGDGEKLQEVIQDVMTNVAFRRQASLLSLSAKSALGQGGSSSENLDFLISKGWHSREAAL